MNLKKQFSVVLVEDNPGDARLMSEYLKESSDISIDLKVIGTLNAAIKYLSSNNADAILLDLSLPDSQGLETLNKINKQFQNIPIIVLTGNDDKENAINALKYGAQDYLSKKHINAELIARTIRYSIERKHSEEKLKESEEKYKALYDNVPLAYQSLNSEGFIIDVNPMWLKTMGYEREEVTGKWFGSFLHEDNVDIFKTNFSTLKKCGSASNISFKLKKKNGDNIYISLEGVVAINPDGTFRQTYCTFKDITEQRALEENEKKHNKLSKIILDSAITYSQIGLDDNIGDCIAAYLHKLTNAKYIVVSSYNKQKNELVSESFLADKEIINQITKLIGKPVVGLVHHPDDFVFAQLSTGTIVQVKGGLYEFAGGSINKTISKAVEKLLGIHSIQVFGFSVNNELLGSAALLLGKGEKIENEDIIKTFLYQTSITIQKRKKEKELRERELKYRVRAKT